MQRTLLSFTTYLLILCSAQGAAEEILLRLQPQAKAPVIARVQATEKVLLDAAPAGDPASALAGWRALTVATFEGYVPETTLTKGLAIVENTAVHYLPKVDSAVMTEATDGDIYEIIRVHDGWATVRFTKAITGYFRPEAGAPKIKLQVSQAQDSQTIQTKQSPQPIVQPVAIPAPRIQINPDEPIGQTAPDALQPENVVWKSAEPTQEPTTKTGLPPSSPLPETAEAIMVAPGETQAREVSIQQKFPAKAARLLTGYLHREINSNGSAYPIRLKSPEGRLIAYVDFSGIYISDLSPYLEQKVYIRGQVHSLTSGSSRLLLLAETIKLAD